MKIQDAYISINNLDIKEPMRKFGPTWSYIFVNKQLEIVAVEKYKKDLSDIDEKKVTSKYKDCVLFIARQNDYSTVDELEERVKSCKRTFQYVQNKF